MQTIYTTQSVTRISVLSALLGLSFAQPLLAQNEQTETQQKSKQERGNWYLSGNFGYAPGSSSVEKLNQEISNNNISGTVTDVKDNRYGWEVGLGFELTDYLAFELGYADLGEVEVRASATQSQLNILFDAIEHIHPESGKGLTFAVVGDLDLSEDWKLIGKLGYFDWDGKYNTYNSGQDVGDDKGSDSNLFYGLGARYQVNYNWDLSLEWKRYEFIHESSDFWTAGFVWYPFAKEQKAKIQAASISPTAQPIVTEPKVEEPVEVAPGIVDSDQDGVSDTLDACPGTAPETAVNASGCPLLSEVTLNVEFETSSDVVVESYLGKIEELANYLKQQTNASVVIQGHTDNRGSEKFNLELSRKRALSVANILVTRFGIESARVASEGFGEQQPITDNDSAASRTKNRRVIAVIQDN